MTLSIDKTKTGFALFVGKTCVRLYSKRGLLKAAEDARMIVYSLSEAGVEWETDIDISPY